MQLEIKSVRSDEDQTRGIRGNCLKVVINGEEYKLPSLCANNHDYSNATSTGKKIAADMFNYHHEEKSGGKITDLNTQKKIKREFQKMKDGHKPKVTSMSFGRNITFSHTTRIDILNLQKDLGTTFIACPESDMRQDVDGLKNDLEELENFDTDQIKCPTIDMECPLPQLTEKARYIVDESRYNRLNIRWARYGAVEKWIMLSKLLYTKKKWCNMTGLFPRRTQGSKNNPNTTSNIVKGLMYGVHTFCFSWPPVRGNTVHLFNRDDWCYQEKPEEYGHELAELHSFNSIQEELSVIHDEIRASTFGDYCMKKEGLRMTVPKLYRSSI